MSFLKDVAQLFVQTKPKTASLAKERLQIIIARESASKVAPDFFPKLEQELLEVIKKYMQVNEKQVSVKLNRSDNIDVLDVSIVVEK